MVHLVFDEDGNFEAAFADKEVAEAYAAGDLEVLEFESALVYNDREA